MNLLKRSGSMAIILLIITICQNAVRAQNISGQKTITTWTKIRNEFSKPTDIARTKLWWFHGETETTKEGITADLEAFKKQGVGGVVYYDQQHGKGENALAAFSKEWWDMFRFAAAEAKRLDLTFETHLSNGYVSGGPWITEEMSMQRLEYTDTLINGGGYFHSMLPAPARKSKSGKVMDVAVLAFPVPDGNWETSLSAKPQIQSNIAPDLARAIIYPYDNKLVNVPAHKAGASVLISLNFGKSFTARSITYRVRPKGKSKTGAMNKPGPSSDDYAGYGYVKQPNIGQLESSEDGIVFTKVCDLKPMYESPSWNQKTISFPALKSKYFRLNLHEWSGAAQGLDLAFGNVVLSAQAKADQWEEKAALNSEFIEGDNTPEYSPSEAIPVKNIIDISAKLDINGKLDWKVPSGKWVVMRFYRTSIGVNIKHGRPNLMGLESDKLSTAATVLQFNSYFKVMRDSLRRVGISLTGLHMDSHEAGSQNWTAGYEHKFAKRRGYHILPYLPALAGYVVGSKTETSSFLLDMRQTLSDLVTNEYFAVLDSLCRQEGVTLTAQAVGNGITMVADNFKAKGRVAKPQGEFWAYQTHGSYDVKEASSAAHIYAKPIASAEAFTDMKFSHSLADMKVVADYAFAFGSQEFVVCASAYQPWLNRIPGSTGGGRQYVLNRNNTLWNYSKPFWDYQARCAALMRNGSSVADVCIYLGENVPLKLLSNRLPVIPEGYDFDVCTKDALMNRLAVSNNHLVLPDGLSYKVLVLESKAELSLEALQQIALLVKGGAIVFGGSPMRLLSLKDLHNKNVYQNLVRQLWGTTASGCRNYGKGKVYWGVSLAEVLKKENVEPDAALRTGNMPDDKVYFAHRRVGENDIYFFNNHSKQPFKDSVRLRSDASHAEYWDPVTGKQYQLPAIASGKPGLLLNISLQPDESGFVVTSRSASALSPKTTGDQEKAVPISGAWQVHFDPKLGGPGTVQFERLTDWSLNQDKSIRYYSGTAVYRKTIKMEKPGAAAQILLRFPQLGSIAQVFLNGKEVQTVWCSPWEADLSPYILQGDNILEIKVTNTLTNRMIGDASLPEAQRFTYSYPAIASAADHLGRSGIIGSVLLVQRNKQLNP